MERNREWNADVKVVMDALKTKLWRENPDQHGKWLALLRELSQVHGVVTPILEIDPEIRVPGFVKYPEPKLILDKYSLISLLHEFGHHLGYCESNCVTYSEQVYQRAYPNGWSKLIRDERGFMVRRPMTIDPHVDIVT